MPLVKSQSCNLMEEGYTRKPAEVAAQFNELYAGTLFLNADMVRNSEHKAGRLLNHPSRRLPLEQVTIVRGDSIEKAAFPHAILAKDVPQIPGRVFDFDWSEEAMADFQKWGSLWLGKDLNRLLDLDTVTGMFPDQVVGEIVAMAKSRIDENGIPKEAPPKKDMSILYFEQKEAEEKGHLQDVITKVAKARQDGCATVAEIRAWIEQNNPELFGREKNWVKDAMIEYVDRLEPSQEQ